MTNYRYWMLTAILATSIVLLIAQPDEELNALTYVLLLIGSKVGAVSCLMLCGWLIRYWGNAGKIEELDKLMEED